MKLNNARPYFTNINNILSIGMLNLKVIFNLLKADVKSVQSVAKRFQKMYFVTICIHST